MKVQHMPVLSCRGPKYVGMTLKIEILRRFA
jgi:hypothetical protein